MKISDLLRDFADTHLLRGIADTIDQQEEDKADTADVPVTTVVSPAAPEEPAEQPTDVMVPPLQLELELLKKSAGVENIHDEEEEEETPAHAYPDLLKQIKQNAGLSSNVNNEINNALLGK
jgi:hypothetical protein